LACFATCLPVPAQAAPASPFEGSRAQGGRDRLRPRWPLRDRPIIVGSLYNGQDEQPFAAGIDAGVNHPGVISGYGAWRGEG
jgi:hypothetical protein